MPKSIRQSLHFATLCELGCPDSLGHEWYAEYLGVALAHPYAQRLNGHAVGHVQITKDVVDIVFCGTKGNTGIELQLLFSV